MSNDPTKSDRPGVVEKYTSATHASSLTVTPDRTGAADSLIAAGWSQSRLGAALLRLHSEADGTSEPRRLPDTTLAVLAREIARDLHRAKKRRTDKVTEADHAAARLQAGQWYLEEHALRLQRLKTLPAVREQLALWAFASNIPQPLEVVAGAIHWWLNKQCHVCHGRRWQPIPGTPKLSNRSCEACNATGVREMPHGVATKVVLAYISDCVNAARAGMQKRFRHAPDS